jgi:hypothetical protein
VVWFLEREDDLLICEIRQDEATAVYEFEIAGRDGKPTTLTFDTPTELITTYLDNQSRLMAQGWRPSAGNVTALE